MTKANLVAERRECGFEICRFKNYTSGTDLIEQLSKAIHDNPQYHSTRISIKTAGDEYNYKQWMELWGYRLETDEEMADRIKAEKRWDEMKKREHSKEYQEYQRLKNKFE
jgi:hypothetical protein